MGTAVKYVAALNVDATLVKCYVYAVFRDSSRLEVVGSGSDHITFVYPAIGRIEIDHAKLWTSVIYTIKTAMEEANLTAKQIAFLALTAHRGSFTCWNRSNGMVYHNFITAQDQRADQMVKECNEEFMFKTFKASSGLLHYVTRNQRYLSQKEFEVTNSHVTMRLAWMLENCPGIQHDQEVGNVLFGTIDAWLLYRFRQGDDSKREVEHISDVTSCAATGFYDPFTHEWTQWAPMLYPIKKDMLPKVVNNSYDFGYIHASLFGSAIKIGTSMSNISAALWGTGSFDRTDLYIRIDSSAVVNIITGPTCMGSEHGLVPTVAYMWTHRISDHEERSYVLEKICNDCTTVIDWGIKIGLFTNPDDASTLASSVPDTNGVFYIPAFSVFGVRDITAGSSFIGMKKSTRKEHLVRALLESLVYRVALLYVSAHKEIQNQEIDDFRKIKVDGSVARNDFICQTLADITGLPVERSDVVDASAFGAVLLAGINEGLLRSKQDAMSLRKVDKVFTPHPNYKLKLLRNMRCWENIVEKFKEHQ
ncbi:putative glycerol kinase 5 [Aedes albopictus]|uniref:glycerol kinase n=1 Tax=Aedes albopictus TaxID=7160 RepID=A0ABM1ZHU0_AEDAL